jgi:hypothetical protein
MDCKILRRSKKVDTYYASKTSKKFSKKVAQLEPITYIRDTLLTANPSR